MEQFRFLLPVALAVLLRFVLPLMAFFSSGFVTLSTSFGPLQLLAWLARR